MPNEVRKKNANKKNKIHYFCFQALVNLFDFDQMDSQVDASFGLAFNLRFVWPPTCIDLHCLWSSSNLDASRRKFFYSLATQRKSTQVDRKSSVYA